MSEPKLTEEQLSRPASAATLRDLFACFALVGTLSCVNEDVATAGYDRHAEWAYEQADALLRQREVPSHE